jgi:DNA-binding MarR family transcriptional regulator
MSLSLLNSSGGCWSALREDPPAEIDRPHGDPDRQGVRRTRASRRLSRPVLMQIISVLIISSVMATTLDRDLLFLLSDVGRLVRIHADRRAREDGMTRAQWVILARLERMGGLSQKELADALEVEPISVARLIDRLQARGLVERRPDPTDRRVWRLHLTPAAGPILKRIAAYRAELHDRITQGLDHDAVVHVVEALLGMKSQLLTDESVPDEAA